MDVVALFAEHLEVPTFSHLFSPSGLLVAPGGGSTQLVGRASEVKLRRALPRGCWNEFPQSGEQCAAEAHRSRPLLLWNRGEGASDTWYMRSTGLLCSLLPLPPPTSQKRMDVFLCLPKEKNVLCSRVHVCPHTASGTHTMMTASAVLFSRSLPVCLWSTIDFLSNALYFPLGPGALR